MCVLTFIPRGNGSYTLTNNRDESPKRPKAMPPETYQIHNHLVTFPKDPLGGGTWIASSAYTNLVLLNGGHKIHVPQPPYRQSRGLVILDFFSFKNEVDFFEEYEFNGIEPFTLVGINSSALFQIRWDENGKTLDYFSTQEAKIWSSVTLFTPEVIAERELWFSQFLELNPDPSLDEILNFHMTGGEGNPSTNLNMERGDLVKTLGISQIIHNNNESKLSYFPL